LHLPESNLQRISRSTGKKKNGVRGRKNWQSFSEHELDMSYECPDAGWEWESSALH